MVFESALYYLAHTDFDADTKEDGDTPTTGPDKGSAINHLSDLENRVTLLDRRLAALERLIQLNGDSLQRHGRRKSAVLLHADFDQLSEIIRGATFQSVEEGRDS